jgi:nicotinamide riboside kinase
MKKIALIGTHGVTKSTIVYNLAGLLKRNAINCEVLKEVASDCPMPINEYTTVKAQEWIIFNSYIKEIEEACKKNPTVLVCDRSILDGYIYYVNQFGPNTLLETFIREKIKTYDQLWRVPISFSKLENDGIRSINKDFQLEIDELFNYYIDYFNIEVRKFKHEQDILNTLK